MDSSLKKNNNKNSSEEVKGLRMWWFDGGSQCGLGLIRPVLVASRMDAM